MTVTAVRDGIETHEASDLPGGELLVHALPELPDGAHAPVCLDELFARELHIAATSKQTVKHYSPSKRASVLTEINTRANPAPHDQRLRRSCAIGALGT
jgi:hypothetical protein